MTQNKTFSEEEAKQIGDSIGIDWSRVDLKEFITGLSVELEHGSRDSETNVIDDDFNLAGKIAWAHLKELPDYYTRLATMESEGEAYWSNKER